MGITSQCLCCISQPKHLIFMRRFAFSPMVLWQQGPFTQQLCRYASDTTASATKTGANGSSIYFLGRFYDNVFVRRKGVTSLSWPKPKLKFELPSSVSRVFDPQTTWSPCQVMHTVLLECVARVQKSCAKQLAGLKCSKKFSVKYCGHCRSFLDCKWSHLLISN